KDALDLKLTKELQDILSNKPYKLSKEFSQDDLAIDNKFLGLDHDIPKLGRSKAVIVSGIVFSANRDVAMIQEAKPSARGLWYLPAGRLELNESLEDAVKREFLEEVGLQFEPRLLVSIECRDCHWIRVNFLGEIVGGKLKNKPDEESLCAKWIPLKDVIGARIELRSADIIPLLVLANHLDTRRKKPSIPRLPLAVSWSACHVRLFIHCPGDAVSSDTDSSVSKVLCRVLPDGAGARLPVVRMQHPGSFGVLAGTLTEKLTGRKVQFRAVLHSEFLSANNANCGIFLTLLCRLLPWQQQSASATAKQPPALHQNFAWLPCPQLADPLVLPDEFEQTLSNSAKLNEHCSHLCLLGACSHSDFRLN
ncbi:hypothetical protein BOX15_Mlig031695g1, partial [Macrostomum lignano]